MKRICALFVMLMLLVSTQADAASRRHRRATDQTPAIVQQALSLAQDNRAEAILLLEDYLKRGTNPDLVGIVRIHAGEQRRLAGDLPRARDHFSKAAEGTSRDPNRPAGNLGMALVNIEQSASGNAMATLRLVPEKGIPHTMNADRFRLLALEAHGQANNPPTNGVTELCKKALAYAKEDRLVLQRIQLDLAPLLPAESIPMPAPGAGLSAELTALNRAEAALSRDDFTETLRLLDAMQAAFPENEHQPSADWLRKRAEAEDPFHAQRIGVMLPLSGPYGAAGNQVRHTLEMAQEDSGAGMEFIFRDTAGSVETATEVFEALVLEEGVAAVLGPLLKDVAVPIAETAQIARVPLLALSQAPGITEIGDWVFRGMLTTEQQVASLLAHAMGERELKRFAIMAPDNSYGQTSVETFTRQVVEQDGEIAIAIFYDPEASDLRTAASELGRKDYKARWREFKDLKEEAEEVGMDPDKVVLPPVVDFDAIFIPDSARRVPLVASALAYEEFAIGAFKPKKDMTALPLLGLNAWHNEKLPELGARYVRNSLFVDAFSANSTNPDIEVFVSRYRAVLNQDPGVFEALVYDIGRMVGVTTRMKPESRQNFREAMAGVGLSKPVAGGGSFGDNREVERTLLVFTIDKEGILEVGQDRNEIPTE
ncbi:MAG: penicillin-binding protein activator [Myxococcota bacterium]|nr:penicillin-binding protein activator [Myxococcota bacterium]